MILDGTNYNGDNAMNDGLNDTKPKWINKDKNGKIKEKGQKKKKYCNMKFQNCPIILVQIQILAKNPNKEMSNAMHKCKSNVVLDYEYIWI